MERLKSKEQWQRAEAEVKTLFPEQVNRVAVLLGMTARFTGKNGEPYFYSVAWLEDEDHCIHLTTQDSHPDFRLHISGDYDTGPSDLSVSINGIERPRISVDMHRDAEAIVRQIKLRFLPGYDEARAQIAERVRQATGYRDSVRSNCDRLAAIAGVEVRKVQGTDQLQTEFFKYYGEKPFTHPRMEVKVSSDVSIKIDCGVELAAEIIADLENRVKWRNAKVTPKDVLRSAKP